MVVVAVVLGWEVIKAPISVRAPEQLGNLAVTSPEALGVIAEKRFVAKRYNDAGMVAEESLAKAPFNAKALRVLGLARAQEPSRMSEADELVTLAGNWSLRDDPAHAWLIERRLRQGSYGSAFAHADTLARRREDLHPRIFQLFTRAAAEDSRSLPHLAARVAERPPWRREYLEFLRNDEHGDAVLLYLAASLAGKPGAFSSNELEVLYKHWLGRGRIEAIRQIRRLTASATARPLANGDFEVEYGQQTLPFGWALGASPSLSTQILPDDLDPSQNALRVQVNGTRADVALDQFLLLEPGHYRIDGTYRVEAGDSVARVEWLVRCVESPAPLEVHSSRLRPDQAVWAPFTLAVRVPDTGCTGQHLQLIVRSADRRSPLAFWIDNVGVSAAARGE